MHQYTLEEQIEIIIEDVIDLDLPQDTEDWLTFILDNAMGSIDFENDNASIGKLEAFINKIDALLVSGRISEEEAQAMIDAAEAIIAGIEEG